MKWNPDLQPRFEESQRVWMEWLVRNFRKLSVWTGGVDSGEDLIVYGATITFNAGDGTPEGDLNATDFTGHPHADSDTPTALQIKTNAIVTFGHNLISYIWEGPNGVTVGVGGSYTAVSTDLVPLGTGDHSILSNRDQADQHPMSAITGLDADQQRQDSNLTAHTTRTDNPHQVNHSQLPDVGVDPADPHPQYRLKAPAMLLGGDVDNFTLNTTDSKLVNYTLSGQWGWSDDDDINPVAGEITIPVDGVYQFIANVLGNQGNNTKEEWIELKVNVAGGPDPGRFTTAYLDVPTDKTSVRQLISVWTRAAFAGEVYSLYMWASAGLGTFNMNACTFEIRKLADVGEVS